MISLNVCILMKKLGFFTFYAFMWSHQTQNLYGCVEPGEMHKINLYFLKSTKEIKGDNILYLCLVQTR